MLLLQVVMGSALLALGLFACFFGYRFFRFVGGAIGFGLGMYPLAAVVHSATGETCLTILGGLAGGLIGASLCVALYQVRVFASGFALGLVLVQFMTKMDLIFVFEHQWVVLPLLVFGGGVASLVLGRPVLVVATSFVGAWAAVQEVVGLGAALGIPEHPAAGLGGLVLGVAGLFVQYHWTAKLPGPSSHREGGR